MTNRNPKNPCVLKRHTEIKFLAFWKCRTTSNAEKWHFCARLFETSKIVKMTKKHDFSSCRELRFLRKRSFSRDLHFSMHLMRPLKKVNAGQRTENLYFYSVPFNFFKNLQKSNFHFSSEKRAKNDISS
jgi:hypothetical protein